MVRPARRQFQGTEERPVSTRRLFSPNMICYALNSIFPFRVGEAARAVLVGRREKVSIATALATVAAERVVDSLTILAGLALVFWRVPFGNVEMQYHGFKVDPEKLKELARIYIALPTALLVIAILLMMNAAFRRLVERLIDALGFLPPFLRNAARKVIEAFALGFDSLKSPARVFWIAVHSVLIWALVAWSVPLIAYAFDVPMTFLQGLTITLLICVTILIPAAPGYWGLWEAGFLLAMKLMDLSATPDTVVAMALLTHLTQYAPVILVGAVCAGVSGITLREAAHTAETVQKQAG
ncbi:MAG: lysylphosphatidylglycerol synthase transmembrane domain-containing protein [Candidatus Sumerlaeota bacterium]|nr:lysylphosphatidylglycerol synthase transmembrane domain-containing protein [Candidatus Sumerlaeota bacterium]